MFLDGDLRYYRWFPFYLWGCREELGTWRRLLLLQVEGQEKKKTIDMGIEERKRRVMLGFGVFLREPMEWTNTVFFCGWLQYA